jgi:hypothetical protein
LLILALSNPESYQSSHQKPCFWLPSTCTNTNIISDTTQTHTVDTY